MASVVPQGKLKSIMIALASVWESLSTHFDLAWFPNCRDNVDPKNPQTGAV